MTPTQLRFTASVLAAMLVGGSSFVSAADDHAIVPADEVTWAPAPAVLPKGAEATVLYGDPAKEGLFALRLRLPAGYHIPAHTHPKPEIVTVLSGAFQLGMGETADKSQAQSLPTGSFFAFAPGMAHYAYTDEETVVQLNSTGPWGLTYVNPADDPRKTQ